MAKHLEVLEDLIKDSHKTTELLHNLYFKSVDGEISDSEIIENFSEIYKNICTMQAEINYHIKCAKRHQ